MVKITVDIRFDATPFEEWPEDQRATLSNKLISYVGRELTVDVERALHFVDMAEQHELWRYLGQDSLQDMLASRDLTIDAIEQYRLGAQLLRDKGVAGPIGKKQARKAAVAWAKLEENRLAPHRRPTKQEEVNKGNNVTFTDRGNATPYTLRRLSRDAPDLLDAIERGELSVNAAAIQAGIRKKPTKKEICLRALQSLTSEELHEVQAEVQRLLGEPK